MSPAQPAKKKAAQPRAGSRRDFAEVFAALRELLEPLRGELAVRTDKPGSYETEIPGIIHRGKPLYYAGVRAGKNYVSFYLMSVYYSRDLLQGMSPALKKRMQGKACFNFTAVSQECFAELGRLAADGLKKFRNAEFRQMIQRMQ